MNFQDFQNSKQFVPDTNYIENVHSEDYPTAYLYGDGDSDFIFIGTDGQYHVHIIQREYTSSVLEEIEVRVWLEYFKGERS